MHWNRNLQDVTQGGDIERKLLQRDTFWIHRLNTLSTLGLNEEFDLKTFLKFQNVQTILLFLPKLKIVYHIYTAQKGTLK
jgi:hypothetical protein